MLHTLKSSKEFKRVKSVGRRYVRPAYILEMAPPPSLEDNPLSDQTPPPFRLGLIASKRLGNAVRRNYAKRRIRALWAQAKTQLTQPGDYVFIARSSLLTEKFAFLQEDLYKVLRKIEKDHEIL